MQLLILDTEFNPVDIPEEYNSMIWTDRYQTCGDFEFYTPMNQKTFNMFKTGYYLENTLSNHTMIVESVLIDTDAEDGCFLTVKGRSLESILDRRVIWGLKTLSGNFQNAIKSLLDECIISPTIAERKIPNFIFKESTDPVITALTIDAQYYGDNLYDVVTKLCADKDIGFRITLNDSKQFIFELYTGVDRSYHQDKIPYVLFSPDFDNIINSNYLLSIEPVKNVVMVAGEGEGAARKIITVGSGSGLNRKEVYSDSRDITAKTESGSTLSTAEYDKKLIAKGEEVLKDNKLLTSFEGEVETNNSFIYGEDFFIGDIVQFADKYGNDDKVRIIEFVYSNNEEGLSAYPTFETMNKERSDSTV